MTIPPGSRLGPYKVISSIGAGGMGEVYRARDTTLNRDVALKVLPEEFASDPDRLARFEREAQLLASLNHPNIAAIYGLEHGPPEGGPHVLTDVGSGFSRPIRALVLELVEGPTLADRIARGPIPVDEALPIAKQIADALEAAHEHGVIHRDLKPSNVKVRPDGTVKVLDFGLAKALEDEHGSGDVSQSPTITSPAVTRLGVVLGTAAYMSPEQARGRHANKRSDVWAFGCVLYEMLTGKRAFEGDEISDTIAAVLRAEPDWARLSQMPEPIRRLLRRCLEKDHKQRLRDIGDARLDIDDAQKPEVMHRSSTPIASHRERLAWMMVAIAVLAALVVIAWAWRSGQAAPLSPEMRVEIRTPPTTDPVSLEISPDGRTVAFVATHEGRPRLWLRRLDGLSARSLPGTDFAANPFWSPDGRSIGFFADLKLKRVDIDGGTVQTLARAEVGLGGTWTRDGGILFCARTSNGIYRVADAGSAVVEVTQVHPPQVGHRFPQLLPDGGHFLYYVAGPPEVSGVYSARLDGSDARRLLPADSAATYAPSGHLLFVRQGTLYAQRFDPITVTVTGSPYSVAERVAVDTGFGRPALSVAATGPILYRESATVGMRQFIWFDRKGREIGRLGEASDTGPAHPAVSPDGRRIALVRTVGGNLDVWLMDTDRGTLSRVTSDPSSENIPIWSPDGSRVVFGSTRRSRGGLELYQKRIASSEAEAVLAPLLPGLDTIIPDDWSPDGRFIVVESTDPMHGFDLWALPLADPTKPIPLVRTNFEDRNAQFSPDGKWIAYHSDESGRFELYVLPFPGSGARVTVSTAGATQVRWRRDGKELFYVALDGRLMAVPIRIASDGTLAPGTPEPLFATHILSNLPGQGNNRPQYIASEDGQRFLIHTIVNEDTSPIIVLLNWKPKS